MAGGPVGTEFLSPPLTNFAQARIAGDTSFVARRVLPRIPVDAQTAQYQIVDPGDWYRDEAKPLARASESAGGGWTMSNDVYNAMVYAFHKDNDDQDYANASAARIMDLDRRATRYVTRKIQLSTEMKFASTLMPDDGGDWDDIMNGDAAPNAADEFLFWDDTDATPIVDITNKVIEITERTGGYRPNYLILPPRVYNALRTHPTVTGMFQYTTVPVVTVPMLAQVLEIENVIVPYAVANTAVEGATDDFAFAYGENALLGYFSGGPGEEEETAAALFSWSQLDGAGDQGVRIDRYRIQEKHVTRVEGFAAYDIKIIDPVAATIFVDTLT